MCVCRRKVGFHLSVFFPLFFSFFFFLTCFLLGKTEANLCNEFTSIIVEKAGGRCLHGGTIGVVHMGLVYGGPYGLWLQDTAWVGAAQCAPRGAELHSRSASWSQLHPHCPQWKIANPKLFSCLLSQWSWMDKSLLPSCAFAVGFRPWFRCWFCFSSFVFACGKKKKKNKKKKREIKSFQLKMVGSDLSKVSKSCDIQQLVCCAGISAWLWEGQHHPCAAISSTMSEISVVLHRELTITPGYPGAALLAHKK